MRWLLTTVCVLASAPAFADDALPSRDLLLPLASVENRDPASFDLLDFRDAQRDEGRARLTPRSDVDPHSLFVIKQHVGVAGGYDNGIPHGSVGLYLTVAEWGRWNFGVPTVEIGIGRYPTYDPLTRRSFMKDQVTFLISIASVHYRVGHIRSWGVNWYINLEQVYDLNSNLTGSQFGVSFSRK